MMQVPKSKDEAVTLTGRLLWAASRIHLISLLIGGITAIALQLLVGFWAFRSDHQEIIRQQYAETLDADAAFQRLLEQFNAVFEGAQNLQQEVGLFRDAAQVYIGEIQEVSRLLPRTEDELSAYIDAITALRQYYVLENPPDVGSLEWLTLFGEFRVDFDAYLETREAYLGELSREVGNYWRAVWNS